MQMTIENLDFNIAYSETTGHFPNHTARPVIGISGNLGDRGCELAEGYYRSVEVAGGIPVVIPVTDNRPLLLSLLDRIDGLLLSGGGDINPLLLGEDPCPALGSVTPERDRMELLLARLAFDRQIPILGICRGMQVLTAALGGRIHQDLATAMPGAPLLKHSQQMARGAASHRVTAEADSIVAQLLGTEFCVNSFHHQGVADAGPLLRVTARAADGVAEAVESNEMKSVVGVQWHPECFLLENDKTMMPLFRYFVEEAEKYRQVCEVHRQVLTLDSHCDTPMLFDRGYSPDRRDPRALVDLHKMTEGRLDAVVMAAYLPQGGRSGLELAAATERTDRILASVRQAVRQCHGLSLALTPKALFQAKTIGKKSVLLGIENGYAIGRDLSNIERYRYEGVVYMTLCHNGDNDICDSAVRSQREHGGLSDFGRSVVAEMNRTGMMVDLSHASEDTFYDVLSLSSQPVICSHSSSRALCNHPRNLSDDQLRSLAARGGVAQATFYHGFLREEGEATVCDVVRHIMHMVEVAGIDHVGIGSDFDGDGGVLGLSSAAEMTRLTRMLMAEGLAVKHLRKLWGGNFIRVMSQVQFAGSVKNNTMNNF